MDLKAIIAALASLVTVLALAGSVLVGWGVQSNRIDRNEEKADRVGDEYLEHLKWHLEHAE